MRLVSAIPILLTVLAVIRAVREGRRSGDVSSIVGATTLRWVESILFVLLMWVAYLTWAVWS